MVLWECSNLNRRYLLSPHLTTPPPFLSEQFAICCIIIHTVDQLQFISHAVWLSIRAKIIRRVFAAGHRPHFHHCHSSLILPLTTCCSSPSSPNWYLGIRAIWKLFNFVLLPLILYVLCISINCNCIRMNCCKFVNAIETYVLVSQSASQISN